MVDNLAHRGPDGAGAWSEGSVGLGHRMLWTTPQSLREKLPLVKGSRDLIITADARLDNREELIVALGLGGRPREEVADSELILGAYERWDERCPERLLGDFAFAIWDRRRQEVFCARDHMGVKPLYYYRSDRAFVFASEIKAILCVPGVPRRLNEVRVADYLVTAVEDKEITFYQGILRLPPAHSMTVNREGISKRSYWSLDSSREVRFRSDQEYAEAYREVFTEAVSCRLRSAFPVGSHLSGGLDSSSIACVARELLESDGDRQLHTISAIFEDLPQCDERPFIGAVLDQGRLEPHFVKDADLLSPLANLDRVLWHEDEPFVVAHLTMFWSLCRAAHQQGARIFLRGDGGDNTVSYGLTYLRELALMGRWMTMATEIHGLCRHSHFSPCSPWSLLLRYVLRPLAPEPVRRAWRMLRRRNRPPWAVDTVIRLDFARRVGLAERYQTLERAHMSPARTLREEHWLDLTGGEHAAWLEVCERISAAFSIEDRYPFYDRRLLEFCLALPPEQKLNKGWTRVVARRALSGTLPKEVQWRSSKGNLSPAFHRGLLTADRVFLERVISEDLQLIEPYVDVAALRETYHRYRLEPTNAAGFTIWNAVTLAFWLRQTGLTG
jgi:asparagine synthase (glutamine-hydrolysing)